MNVGLFDYGGGTYDLCMAEMEPGKDPVLKETHYGGVQGGSHVDDGFITDVAKFAGFDSLPNITIQQKSLALMNIKH